MANTRTPYIIIFLLMFGLNISAQQTITSTLMHGGVERDYIVYIPESYDATENVPLVLNFHGYGSNAFQQMNYGDFRAIADREGFIVVHPNGTVDLLGSTHWNVGWGTSTVDDVNFISTLIDQLIEDYAINAERIYSTGMSNGGFISYELACQLSHRIAAIASVTGAMSFATYQACNPSRPVPVLQIHGTADNTVPYDGGLVNRSIDECMTYWVNHNDCDEMPSVMAIDDVNTNDQSTVEHHIYVNGELGVNTELFVIDNGGHTWPGTAFGSTGTNYDIDASEEVWKFFARYDINGAIQTASVNGLELDYEISISPNPSTEFVELCWNNDSAAQFQVLVYGVNGQLHSNFERVSNCQRLNISSLPQGLYYLYIKETTTGRSSSQKIIKI
ncbi:MAG: T9SS type A sorting domain-containing protein [Saprospiraceae bacterium]|nr:T9SS type A sorting domain-containing protein [Saprospiraceae bacterium]